MKVTQVVIAAGADFTNVRCTVAAHLMKIFDASASRLQLDFKSKLDDFATITSSVPLEANVITLAGANLYGVLGRPPNYCGEDEPTDGDIIAKVRTTAAAGCTVTVYEYE